MEMNRVQITSVIHQLWAGATDENKQTQTSIDDIWGGSDSLYIVHLPWPMKTQQWLLMGYSTVPFFILLIPMEISDCLKENSITVFSEKRHVCAAFAFYVFTLLYFEITEARDEKDKTWFIVRPTCQTCLAGTDNILVYSIGLSQMLPGGCGVHLQF